MFGKESKPDKDLEKHLDKDGFKIHGVMFTHHDLIQSTFFLSRFCYKAVQGNKDFESNTMLITIDPKRKKIFASAANYNQPIGDDGKPMKDDRNTAMVQGSTISYFFSRGYCIDNFDFLDMPKHDFVTADGDICITGNDIEAIVKPFA